MKKKEKEGVVMVEIVVHCSFDKMVDTHKLIPNPQNPNTHPEEQIQQLAEIIQVTGWRAPITVSKRSGYIVKGHGRLMAAELLGCEKVPVDYQDYENDSLELADLMADNRIAELSKINNRKLLNLFEEFDTGEVDFTLSGYDEKFYEELAHSFDEYEKKNIEENEEVEETEETEKIEKTELITCPNCGQKIEV